MTDEWKALTEEQFKDKLWAAVLCLEKTPEATEKMLEKMWQGHLSDLLEEQKREELGMPYGKH